MGTYPARSPDAMTVVIPMVPDRCLAPNARRTAHWSAQHRATRDLRAMACFAGLHARGSVAGIGGGPVFAEPVTIACLIRWPKGRRRVDPNSLPDLVKAALDGLVDAAIIAGDSFRQITEISYAQERTGGDGETVVTIRRTACSRR